MSGGSFRKYDGVVGGVEQGVVQVTRYLLRNGHSVVLLCKKRNEQQVETLFSDMPDLKIIPLRVDSHVMSEENAHLDSHDIQDIAESENANLIHFPYNWSFPKRKKRPSVLTIHDVIPFTFREAMDEHTNLHKYRPGITRACQLNDAIATVSEFSKKDISEKVGVPLDKINVIYNGLRVPHPVDNNLEAELKRRFRLADRFILNVGGIHERKNIIRLIQAYAGLVKDFDYTGNLVITGKASGHPYQEEMRDRCNTAVKENGVQDKVIFTEFITEKELDSFFRMADLLIYPSLYEGFGIPVLEAMLVDTPVITSTVSALPEIAGNAALLVDPSNEKEMLAAMIKLMQSEKMRRELSVKGKERAQSFTWDRNAEMYMDLYRKVCGNQH
jgi:glycosyltransferase involved in cell wall biosynthesis